LTLYPISQEIQQLV